MKKIADSIIQNASAIKNLGGKVSVKLLRRLLVDEIADELTYGESKDEYLKDLNCVKLKELLDKEFDKGIEKDNIELTINIVNVMQKRTREYRLVSGDESDRIDAKDMDSVLFPKKETPPVERSSEFKIDDWKELHIKIRETRPNSISFHKMILEKPSYEKTISKTLDELHLGDKTIEILKWFGMVQEGQSIPYGKRSNVYAVNKALKELFGMDEIPIKTKDGKIFATFNVSYFDINNAIATPHNIHQDSTDVDMDSIASEEDSIDKTDIDPSMEDEENII